MLDKKVSYFKNIVTEEKLGTITIGEFLESFKQPHELVTRLRDGDEPAKRLLPVYAAHGIFKSVRAKSDFSESSGVVIIDIDDVEDDVEEVKADIFETFKSAMAVMVSPSGTGVKVLVKCDEYAITADSYREIGKIISKDYELYGSPDSLSVTDCLIHTYDENILIRRDAETRHVVIIPVEVEDVELEPLDEAKELWESAEEFYETVLYENIVEKSYNNFHFIQMSILDLARYGFYHPDHDLSFVIECSEINHKRSNDNRKRFEEAASVAKARVKQQKWPYNTTVSEDEIDEPKLNIDKLDEKIGDSSSSLIDYSNFFDSVKNVIQEGDRVGNEISLKNFAEVCRFKGTGVFTVTGIPGHGKTEFTDEIILDLARLHGEESLVAGYEQSPQEHVIKLCRKAIGADITAPSFWKSPDNISYVERCVKWITNRIRHIDTSKVGGNINDIINAATDWVLERREAGGNPRYLVVDPFNMLSIKGKLNSNEKAEEILRRLTMFSHKSGVQVILIAHPFKMKKDEKTGVYDIPDFYSVKGSSAFFEMSYHGVTVYRKGGVGGREVLVRILKVKQNNLGTPGADVHFSYVRSSGRYIPLDDEGNEIGGDHYTPDWLGLRNK